MPNYNNRFGGDSNRSGDEDRVQDRDYRTSYRSDYRNDAADDAMDSRDMHPRDSRIYSSDYGWQNADRDYEVNRRQMSRDNDRNENNRSGSWMDRVDRAFNRSMDQMREGNPMRDRGYMNMDRDRNYSSYKNRDHRADYGRDYNRDDHRNMDYQRGNDFGLGMGSDTRSSDLGFGNYFDRNGVNELGRRYDYDLNERNRASGNYGFGNSDYDSSYFGTGRAFSSTRDQDFRNESRMGHAGKGPKGYKRSDDRIKEEVSESLERHPHIDASEIEVDVKDGIITLRGHVEDRRQKRLAEDTIEHLQGVKDVRNELTVNQSLFERAKEFLTGESRTDATSSRH